MSKHSKAEKGSDQWIAHGLVEYMRAKGIDRINSCNEWDAFRKTYVGQKVKPRKLCQDFPELLRWSMDSGREYISIRTEAESTERTHTVRTADVGGGAGGRRAAAGGRVVGGKAVSGRFVGGGAVSGRNVVRGAVSGRNIGYSYVPCRNFANGCCLYGDSCWFLHGPAFTSTKEGNTERSRSTTCDSPSQSLTTFESHLSAEDLDYVKKKLGSTQTIGLKTSSTDVGYGQKVPDWTGLRTRTTDSQGSKLSSDFQEIKSENNKSISDEENVLAMYRLRVDRWDKSALLTYAKSLDSMYGDTNRKAGLVLAKALAARSRFLEPFSRGDEGRRSDYRVDLSDIVKYDENIDVESLPPQVTFVLAGSGLKEEHAARVCISRPAARRIHASTGSCELCVTLWFDYYNQVQNIATTTPLLPMIDLRRELLSSIYYLSLCILHLLMHAM